MTNVRRMMMAAAGVSTGGGRLFAWGRNTNGQLGQGNTTSTSSPVQVGSDDTWVHTYGDDETFFAINEAGELWTVGDGTDGRTGQGNTTDLSALTQIGSQTDWLRADGVGKFSTSEYNVTAIKSTGKLYVWGKNAAGSLGTGNATALSSPVQLGAKTDFTYVATTTEATCFISGGKLYTSGQGNGTGRGGSTSYSPVQVGSQTDWSLLQPSRGGFMAVKTTGKMYTWGYGSTGVLGNGSTSNLNSPVQVGALTDWIGSGLTKGHMRYAHIALKSDGTAWAWGRNGFGILAQGNTTNTSSPVQIGSLTTWTHLSSGSITGEQVAAGIIAGKLYTWGRGTYGGLGHGDTESLSSPVQVGTGSTWTSIACGKDCMMGVF